MIDGYVKVLILERDTPGRTLEFAGALDPFGRADGGLGRRNGVDGVGINIPSVKLAAR